jgi:molecular chaperone DnaK
VEKDAGEWGDKVDAEHKARLDKAVQDAKDALKGNDAERMNAARDELSQAFSPAGQQVYQAQAAESAGREAAEGPVVEEEPSSRGRGPVDEDVVEADYEIVEDEKK